MAPGIIGGDQRPDRKYRMQTSTDDSAETNAARTRKGKARYWIWHGLVIAMVGFAAWHFIDFGELIRTISGPDTAFLILAFVMMTIDRFVMAAKWHHLMKIIRLQVNFLSVLNAYYQASFIVRMIPTSLSGDVLRGVKLSASTRTWDQVLGSMIMEKALGFLASAALATFAAALLSGNLAQEGVESIVVGIPIAAGFLLFLFYVSFSESVGQLFERLVVWHKARRVLSKLRAAYVMYRDYFGQVVLNYVLTVGEQLLQIAYLLVCALAIGIEVDFWLLFLALSLSQFLRKMAIVLEGWALGEFVLILTCAMIGINQTQVLAFSLLSHAIGILASLPGAVLMVFSRKPEHKTLDRKSE